MIRALSWPRGIGLFIATVGSLVTTVYELNDEKTIDPATFLAYAAMSIVAGPTSPQP
jgi:hypothetical protein